MKSKRILLGCLMYVACVKCNEKVSCRWASVNGTIFKHLLFGRRSRRRVHLGPQPQHNNTGVASERKLRGHEFRFSS